MGGTLATHEIPLTTIPRPSGASGAFPLVTQKAEEMQQVARGAVESTTTAVESINNFLNDLNKINTAITVPSINTSLPFDPLSFIEALPGEPTLVMPTPPSSLVWNASNAMMSSTLMNNIKTRLSDILVNGISVLAAIETAI